MESGGRGEDVCCKQSRACVYLGCRGGAVEGEELAEILCLFFFLFLTFLFILDLFGLLGTQSACSASYAVQKAPITNQLAPGNRASTQVPIG